METGRRFSTSLWQKVRARDVVDVPVSVRSQQAIKPGKYRNHVLLLDTKRPLVSSVTKLDSQEHRRRKISVGPVLNLNLV